MRVNHPGETALAPSGGRAAVGRLSRMPWITHQNIYPGDLGEITVMRDKSGSTDV